MAVNKTAPMVREKVGFQDINSQKTKNMEDKNRKLHEEQDKRDINIDRNTDVDRGEHMTQDEGGTTDMGTEPRGNVPGRTTGSGLGTKTSVTGSDFDGQVG